jgi:hypothetical protein
VVILGKKKGYLNKHLKDPSSIGGSGSLSAGGWWDPFYPNASGLPPLGSGWLRGNKKACHQGQWLGGQRWMELLSEDG